MARYDLYIGHFNNGPNVMQGMDFTATLFTPFTCFIDIAHRFGLLQYHETQLA